METRVDVHDRMIKIIRPETITLAEAENDLAVQMEKLNSKKVELQEILDKLFITALQKSPRRRSVLRTNLITARRNSI